MKTNINLLFLPVFLLSGLYLPAQEIRQSAPGAVAGRETGSRPGVADPLGIANEYIRMHLGEWGLAPQDIEGMTVNDMYADKSSGITRIYFRQRYRGIPVYNAILNISITKDGEVFFAGKRFVQDLAGKINTTAPVLRPEEAVLKLAGSLGLEPGEVRLKEQSGASQFVFDKGSMAKEDITAGLSFQPFEGKVLLAWDILFEPAGRNDKWSARVDAVSGAVLNKFNWTVYCRPDGRAFSGYGNNCDDHPGFTDSNFAPALTGAQYNVWPAPTESPSHGPRTMVADPSDPVASPYGWHDINGQPGAEYTITRGNNVFAYEDRKNIGQSSNDEPDGGPALHFDFPFDASWEPEQYMDASVVNLFYWANYMHDFAYRFGFDEQAGNFQINNYGKGGVGNDKMYAIAQAGADAGFSANPYYHHGNEGSSGTIFMMEYYRTPTFLTVTEPVAVAGQYITSIADAGWGAGSYVTSVPVTAEVVPVNDGVEDPGISDACEDIINAPELAGKIALIDRGGCEFGIKVLKAQNAGAIGVIICNFDNEFIGLLAPASQGANVHIPVVLISAEDGQIIRKYIGNGLKVSLVNSGQSGPSAYDMSLDNGFIAHEYGHGISWRLAGGPDAACFDNTEQMDEGWSDFFALATTVRQGDTGAKKRGIGSYFIDEATTGRGCRRYPYSTDMNISPLTYGDIAPSQERHDVGEVWGNMIWDMYWAFVDKYGWNADLSDESSGNYKAIRLVFDGLKNLPCSPGFVDGRNAILAADEALFNGENSCLLWEVFARRGLGYSADQGSPFDAGDQKEAFDVPPSCANRIIIEKTVTDLIQPGDDIEVTLKIANYKAETATNVAVTDEIPAGTSFKPNSSSMPAVVQGSTVTFSLGNMNSMEEATITYTLKSAPGAWSQRKFLDEVTAVSSTDWLAYSIGNDAPNVWSVTDSFPAHSGNLSWHTKEIPEESLQALELDPGVYSFHVNGDHPALRFYHRYQTQGGINGGLVEVREVGANSWDQVGDDMIRNGYPGFISYLSLNAPNLRAFSGNSGNDFKATYVDLSKWAGKDIQIRFRFGTDVNTHNGMGWLIDDIEFLNLIAYNGEACVTTDQGDDVCAFAPEAGTIVDSKADPLDATEQFKEISAKIYPNPARNLVTVALSGDHKQDVRLSLLTPDGRELFAKSLSIFGNGCMDIDTGNFPAGLYFVKIVSEEGRFVSKLIVQK